MMAQAPPSLQDFLPSGFLDLRENARTPLHPRDRHAEVKIDAGPLVVHLGDSRGGKNLPGEGTASVLCTNPGVDGFYWGELGPGNEGLEALSQDGVGEGKI